MKYDFKVYRDQGYSDQQIFDALAEKEPALKTYLDQGYAPDQVLGAMENLGKPEEEPGFFGNIATLTKEGAETALTAARLSGDVATGEFDVNAPGLIAGQLNVDQTKKPKEYTEVAESFAPAQQAKEQAGDWSNPLDNLGAVGKMIWNVGEQAVTNPKGLAYLTASQIANMAPAMAGMLVGAKGGAAAGTVAAPITGGASVPIGAVIGGVVGGFTGEWPMEAGSEFIGIIGKELAARELDPTEKNISDLLADKQFMEGAVSQARTKATVTSAIDAAMTMGAGRLVGAPGRAAEKAARAELGASATASEVAKRASEIVAARSLLQKTGNVSKAVGLDVAGGGLSEAGGQVAAYGEADLSDVGMEMLGELGGSGIEIPGAAWAAGQDAMKARKPVEPADIMNAPDAEAATEAFVAATDQLVDSIIADELVQESAQPADVAAVSPVEQAAPPIQGAVDGTITPAEAPGMAPAGQPVVDNIPQGGDRAGVPGADVAGTPAAGVDGDRLAGAPTPSTGQAGIVPRSTDQAVTPLTQGEQNAIQVGRSAEEISRTGAARADLVEGGEGIRQGQQGEEITGEGKTEKEIIPAIKVLSDGRYAAIGFTPEQIKAADSKAFIDSKGNGVFPANTNKIQLERALGISTIPENAILADGNRPYKNQSFAIIDRKARGLNKTHITQKIEGGYALVPKEVKGEQRTTESITQQTDNVAAGEVVLPAKPEEGAAKPLGEARVVKPENGATYSTFKDGRMIRVSADGVVPAMFGAKFERQAKEYYEGLKSAANPKQYAKEWSDKVKSYTEQAIEPQPTQENAQPSEQEPKKKREPSSWVIKNKETGEVVMETFDKKKVDALNTEKYEAVPIQQHLESLNTGTYKETVEKEYAAKKKLESEKPDTRFVDGIIQLKAIPKNLTIENPATGKGKYNARKVMTAANQRVERLEALKRCLS